LVYTCEPVFAAIFSVWLLEEYLGMIAWTGGGLIVIGMLVAAVIPALLGRRGAV
jgi:drug/metabolite transporter (DMT)-like permease